MTDNSMLMPPGGPASPPTAETRPGSPGRALLAAVLIVVGSVLAGLAGGAIWAAVAPRVLYQVYTLNPPTAYATNPETSAFIAADGWYCFIALAGGALIGLVGYVFGVRRYGPVPMAGIVVGSTTAAFVSAWVGHRLSGSSGFDHLLATSKPGTFLHAPISLGSHGALAFWPLAAAVVAGGIVLIGMLRVRHQVPDGGVPMPGMESFGSRPYSGRRGSGQPPPAPRPAGPGPTSAGQADFGADPGRLGFRADQGQPGLSGPDGGSGYDSWPDQARFAGSDGRPGYRPQSDEAGFSGTATQPGADAHGSLGRPGPPDGESGPGVG
jgi:hypothetical protein